MNHEFYILKDEQKIGSPSWYLLAESEKLSRVFVDNEIIVNNHYFISTGQRPKPSHITGFKTFLVYFENEGDGLDYWGETIIPTTSLPKFIENIQHAKKEIKKRKYLKEMDSLIELCKYAIEHNKYVLHDGI